MKFLIFTFSFRLFFFVDFILSMFALYWLMGPGFTSTPAINLWLGSKRANVNFYQF